ncbi:hypothetical protein [uncultured Jatrophihabitans sp.]|uniref:hypothetical protein n=1 Tax=uncultured Jatrophihabitans sp. TaxID=1610747 RepID=UPI0035CBFFCA
MRVPNNPLGRAVDAAAHGPDLARRVTALVPRVIRLLDSADGLVERLEALLDRLEGCEAQVQGVVQRVSGSELAARSVIGQVAQTHRRAESLLDTYEPLLKRSVDTAAYASDRFGPDQVDSVIDFLDHQQVLRKLEEVLPMLAGLGTVAPDLKELIAVSRGFNELLGSVPGLGKAKRRVDEELEDLQDEADDPNSPRQ